MKRYLILLLCALLPFTALAQSGRLVNGVVFDENDTPVKGVKVGVTGGTEEFVTGDNGQFQFMVSAYAKYLVASRDGYVTQSAEIDGSYIVFKMRVDKDYAKRKEAEQRAAAEAEQARIAAEQQAKLEAQRRAEAEAKAAELARQEAERKAAEEAAAKAKAEEQARIAAEKAEAARIKAEEQARLAAEKKAAEEEAAKARAEEQARLAAERKAAEEAAAKIKAAEAARKASEKQAVAEAAAKAKAEKLAEKQEAKRQYDAQYKNKGIISAVELSYGYHLCRGNDVVYKNLGYKYYGNLSPVEFTYAFGYRFCNAFSLSAGAGVQYNLVNLCKAGDVFDPLYADAEKYTPINIPIFINSKIYMTRGKFQPILSVTGGIYAPNMELLADAGVGLNIRLGKIGNMYFLASVRTTPYGEFIEGIPADEYIYKNDYVCTPTFKLGFTF